MPAGRYSRFIRAIHFTGDFVIFNISFVMVYQLLFGERGTPYSGDYLLLLLFFNLFWLMVISMLRIYEIYRVVRYEQIFINMIKAIFLHALFISTLVLTLRLTDISRKHLIVTYAVFVILLIGWRVLVLEALKIYRKKGFNYRKLVIVGAGPVGNALMEFLTSNVAYGYQFLGFFDDHSDKCLYKEKVLGAVEAVKQYALDNQVDEIYCSLPDSAGDKVRDLIEFADKNLIRIKIIPDFKRYIPKKVTIDFYGSIPVILLRREPLENPLNRWAKRIFDVFFSLLVIIFVLSWFFPVMWVLIRLSSSGPVLFKQLRSGERNRVFLCWKFRTMKITDQDQEEPAADRITPLGHFLRSTYMDELPQFINVLKGDMSVVGPRPHMLKHTQEYAEIIGKFMVRHFVRPGITGWAQVNGFRGEVRDSDMLLKRVQYDVWYIENCSFLLDIKIILLTLRNMIRGDQHVA